MNALNWFLLIILAALAPAFFVLPSAAQSNQRYYYVRDTRPPDAFLALRTQPSGSSGQKIMEMVNGTLLEVLQRRSDGWWYVRVVASGTTGWALSQYRDRVWIYCCTAGQNIGRVPTDIKTAKIVTMTPGELRSFGMTYTSVGMAGTFPNRCPTRTYNRWSQDGFTEADRLLSISDEMRDHFKARGFSLEALCLALLSPILYDSETAEPLPVSSLGPLLNVPDCFRNGTPLLDCRVNVLWQDGSDLAISGERLGKVPELHAHVRARLMPLQAGDWYYSTDYIPNDNSWWPFQAFQRSPNLPRGYGYMLLGLEGDDPASETVDLQSVQKKSGSSAPWIQSR